MNTSVPIYSELASSIWKSMFTLIKIVYRDYETLINFAGSVLIVYSCFLLGRCKRSSQLERKISAINQYEHNITKVSETQKRRLKLIKALKFAVVSAILLVGISNVMLFLAEKEANQLLGLVGISPIVKTNEKIAIVGASAVLLLFAWMGLTKILNHMATIDKRHLSTLEQQEEPELNEVIKLIGSKAVTKIKQNQCQDTLNNLSKKNNLAGGCSKCSQEHSEPTLLKQKYNNYHQLLKKTFAFDWCSVCISKNRTPAFEESQETVAEKPFKDEEEEVAYRVIVLREKCDRVERYLKSLCQRECSRRYWVESIKNVKKFKVTNTDVENQLQAYHGVKS